MRCADIYKRRVIKQKLILKVSDIISCKKALQKIQDGYKPNKQKFINFLSAIDKTTIEAYFYDKFKIYCLVQKSICD